MWPKHKKFKNKQKHPLSSWRDRPGRDGPGKLEAEVAQPWLETPSWGPGARPGLGLLIPGCLATNLPLWPPWPGDSTWLPLRMHLLGMCLFPFWFPQCVCPAVGLLDHKAFQFCIFCFCYHFCFCFITILNHQKKSRSNFFSGMDI